MCFSPIFQYGGKRMNLLAVFGNGEMNVSEALGVVVTGLAVVFLVLILLVAIFSFTGLFFKPKKKKEMKEDAAPAPEVTVPASDDKGSVVAAITAALHQFLGGGFIIRKIRPLKVEKGKNDAWSLDGKTDNTRPF